VFFFFLSETNHQIVETLKNIQQNPNIEKNLSHFYIQFKQKLKQKKQNAHKRLLNMPEMICKSHFETNVRLFK